MFRHGCYRGPVYLWCATCALSQASTRNTSPGAAATAAAAAAAAGAAVDRDHRQPREGTGERREAEHPDLTSSDMVAFSSRLIAAARAFESRRTDRLFSDPYAELLVSGLIRTS